MSEDVRDTAGGVPHDAPREPDGAERAPGPWDNRTARVAGIVLFAGIVAALTLSGSIGWAFSLLVLAPVVAAMALSEAGRPVGSGRARVGAVVGLVVWLATTGGLPLLLVVAAVVLMIFLHELGHYLAARWSGMKVTEFFLGFGTRLWSFRRGETEFGLKAVPAGAYVKIIGMNNLEEVDPADEARTYRRAPFRNRLAVAVAGSGMHFLLALVLLVVQFAFIGQADEERWSVGSLTEGGAAARGGILEGDRITAFDGEPVGSFGDFRDAIAGAPSGTVAVEVERDGRTEVVDVTMTRRAKVIGTVGTDVDVLEGPSGLVVGPLGPNSRGERAGLETGQPILAVEGVEVDDLDDLASAVDGTTGGAVTFTVEGSDGEPTAATVDLGSSLDTTAPAAFLGVGAEPVLVTSSLTAALGDSVTEFGRGVGASVTGIVTVFSPSRLAGFMSSAVTGEDQDVTEAPTPADEVAVSTDAGRPTSIIGAVAYGADLTAENLSNLVGFLVVLNIFIGVFNLIPLLPFDGGHVAIAVYEKAREVATRSKDRHIADVSRMIPVAYTVVMVLAVVGLMAVYLDITRGVSA